MFIYSSGLSAFYSLVISILNVAILVLAFIGLITVIKYFSKKRKK